MLSLLQRGTLVHTYSDCISDCMVSASTMWVALVHADLRLVPWQQSTMATNYHGNKLPQQQSTMETKYHRKQIIMATDICSLVPRPTPFFVLQFAFSIIHGGVFCALLLSCIILDTNWRTKKRGRPGNEISCGHVKAATDAWLPIKLECLESC